MLKSLNKSSTPGLSLDHSLLFYIPEVNSGQGEMNVPAMYFNVTCGALPDGVRSGYGFVDRGPIEMGVIEPIGSMPAPGVWDIPRGMGEGGAMDDSTLGRAPGELCVRRRDEAEADTREKSAYMEREECPRPTDAAKRGERRAMGGAR